MKLLNLSSDERETLQASGFYYSDSGDFNTTFDAGWIERQSLFQTVVAEDPDYINTPRLLLGKLYTDLNTLECGVPPVKLDYGLKPSSKFTIKLDYKDRIWFHLKKQAYLAAADITRRAASNLRLHKVNKPIYL